MEIKFQSSLFLFFLQLLEQHLLVDADSHGRQFDGTFQHVIPQQEVAVESRQSVQTGCRVVVIDRSPSVVLLAVTQLAADTDDEYGSVLLANGMFAVFGCEGGIELA